MKVLTDVLHAAVRMTTPILLATLGGLFTQQAGVLNIALDGIMLLGAFIGVVVSILTGNVYLAILMAIISGLLIGVIFSYFSISLDGNFIIIGLAVNMFATGVSAFSLMTFFNTRGLLSSDKIVGLDPIHFDFLDYIPVIGKILNDHTPLVYFSFLAVIITHIIIYKTIYGLRLRTVVESPEAAEALGLKVSKLKYSAVLMSGVFSALAGVNLALGNIKAFAEGMTNGRGFIAVAAIFCGRGTPVGGTIASFVFGLADAIQMRLQSFNLPGNFVQMIPFLSIVIILTVVGIIKRRNSLRRGDFYG